MKETYNEWYRDFSDFVEIFGEDEVYSALDSLLRASHNTFAFNRKLMEKAIDVSWVEAIENGLVHIDNFLRDPRRTIEDVEEIVPIALSRKITVESVKHLAQHTDYIQNIDKKTGRITPSKILNIHKEESLFTYENKFVNTLIDRLFIFINTRYEKLAQVARDEEVYSLGYDTEIDDGKGGRMKVELKLETIDSLDSYDDNGYTVWQRVEKLKKAIEGYKGSELCRTLGNTYIRPPVMRTNAIMKNIDLKACLTLWQYIESYDKVGYEINVQNSAVKPQDGYIEDFYKVVVLNLLLFRSYMNADTADKLTELKAQKPKRIAPKFLKRFDRELAADYSVSSEAVAGYIAADGGFRLEKKLPPDLNQMFEQINEVIETETEYLREREIKRKEAERLRLEEEERRAEQARIEEARKEDLERQRIAKAEEEKRLQEMLAKERAEQEAEERERQRLEEERLARLEEIRRREEEARQKRAEEERIAAERERIEQNRKLAVSELGEAEGIGEEELNKAGNAEELEKKAYESVTEEEIAAAKEAMDERGKADDETAEDPRAVAARMKLEQQRREKERAEAERAQRLKAEREHFENKPFMEIYREYSWNPIYVLIRLIRHILATVFGIIPEDTDNPLYRQLLANKKAKKAEKERMKHEHEEMEIYYRKYAKVAKYELRRYISDWRFKRKKRLEDRKKPKPVYVPPVRTPEETAAVEAEMKRLYKEYRVSPAEKLVRAWNERKAEKKELENSIRQNGEKIREIKNAEAGTSEDNADENDRSNSIANIIASVLVIASLAFVIYVMVYSAQGKAVNVFGHSILKVVTGSMEPTLRVDDYIIIRKTDPSELAEGDIISFYSDQSDIRGKLVTHRIVGVDEDGRFITRGDANPTEDSTHADPDKIAGKFVRKARFFMWADSFTDARKLILLLVMIPTTLIALYEMKTVMKLGRQISEDSEEDERARREAAVREAIEKEKRRLEEIGYRPEDDDDEDKSGIDNEKENG